MVVSLQRSLLLQNPNDKADIVTSVELNELQSSPAINFGYLFAAKTTSIQSLLVFYSNIAINPAETPLSALKTKPMCTN